MLPVVTVCEKPVIAVGADVDCLRWSQSKLQPARAHTIASGRPTWPYGGTAETRGSYCTLNVTRRIGVLVRGIWAVPVPPSKIKGSPTVQMR